MRAGLYSRTKAVTLCSPAQEGQSCQMKQGKDTLRPRAPGPKLTGDLMKCGNEISLTMVYVVFFFNFLASTLNTLCANDPRLQGCLAGSVDFARQAPSPPRPSCSESLCPLASVRFGQWEAPAGDKGREKGDRRPQFCLADSPCSYSLSLGVPLVPAELGVP